MTIQNIEIKARCNTPERIRNILQKHEANFEGTDHQIDTYFNVDNDRLKLREGDIENNLIYYRRTDTAKPKRSDIHLMHVQDSSRLKSLLAAALGVEVVVDKQREIYFIDNVKFHIDKVKQLGNFVEIEAIDKTGSLSEAKLHKQCKYYIQLFDISDEDLLAQSYSDMVTV